MSISTALTPLLQSFPTFMILAVFFGLGEGGFDTACHAWILEMWENDNGPYMQALHFTFGLGTVLAPLISYKFLGENIHKHVNTVSSVQEFPINNMTSSTQLMISGPSVERSRKSSKASLLRSHESTAGESVKLLNNNFEAKHLSDRTRGKPYSKGYLISLVSICSVMFCFYEGMENINFEYLATFNINTELELSKQTSDLIASAMSTAYTIGRGVGIFLAIKIQPKYFLYLDLILISLGNGILYAFSNTSEVMVYIGTITLGFGFSTVFPCVFSYMELFIPMTDMICGIITVSGALIAIIDPIIVGRYITEAPYILLYLNIGSTILVIIAFLTIETITYITKQRERRALIQNSYNTFESQTSGSH
ncbi:unnamed protein product [Oppiella nova]|uniref:Uncharacterized protein n=1 Tax=Oppiella nova TaxID=334625 RepID=A0A7R9LMS9_9ACAR|nr:unnamed protein product [Oppiella nova]CAG2164568.1 unnamed protein product [Oppiella nova]